MARRAEPRKKLPDVGGQAPLRKLDIFWITAGLGCDGDTIAMTAATQPSIEDIVLGRDPGLPEGQLPQSGAGLRERRRLHRTSSIAAAQEANWTRSSWSWKARSPTRTNKTEGYWAAFGTDPATGQPITDLRVDRRLAPQAWAVVAAGTCATYGGIHAMEGNPTGCMGLPDYLGWQWRSKAGIPIVCCPGCPVQPDNFMETLLYLLYQAAGRAPMIPLDDALRPTWLFGQTVHEGCDRGGYYEQADFAEEYGSPQVHRQARMLGAGGAVQRRQTRLDGRHRRLPERRRHLHRLHDARISRQVHALHG